MLLAPSLAQHKLSDDTRWLSSKDYRRSGQFDLESITPPGGRHRHLLLTWALQE
jgi:hypothetical protein